jgi:proteic killer suppression protein
MRYISYLNRKPAVIKSWKDKIAETVFAGTAPKGFPADLAKAARRRLTQLSAATRLDDLRTPPGNRLHRLTGDREGQWSISVNDQFRICFRWTEDGPEDVEFVDYH